VRRSSSSLSVAVSQCSRIQAHTASLMAALSKMSSRTTIRFLRNTFGPVAVNETGWT